jgi:hypothetical protein
VRLWCDAVKSLDREQLDDFERRTFRDWDASSLGDLSRAIQVRRRELAA